MFDACIFGGLFKGCQLDYGIFWTFVTAVATAVMAAIIYFQLRSLKQDSATSAAKSYVDLIQTGGSTGLITQIAATRAIRQLKFIEPSEVINDLDATLKHFQSSQVREPALEKELEGTIAVMRNR